MPTARAYTFLVAALVFYAFANQTQTGWLYVVSALLAGIVVASGVLNRGSVKRIHLRRDVPSDEIRHEGDDLKITLHLDNQRRLPAAHLQLVEQCPLAPPDSPEHDLSMFIPLLPQTVDFDYTVSIYRRGLHEFPPVALQSRAPFGFFRRQTELSTATPVLVYPEVRELTGLSLLDRQPAAELTNPRAGIGSEVIGVRPYQPGDSPRHIHWRSVARHQQLISKEFAQETQPGVTIVLDRYSPLPYDALNKHTPFEMAVKCAVSIADYALRRGYPVHLAADGEDFAVPQGALIRDTMLQYTARVTERQQATINDVLLYQPMQRYVAVVLAYPDDSVLEPLLALKQRGLSLLVVISNPETFPVEMPISAHALADALRANDIAVRVINHGEDWALQLSDDDTVETHRERVVS